MPGEPYPLSFAFRSYLEAGAWRCGNSPPQAHHWIQVKGDEFRCCNCGEIRMFPTDFRAARGTAEDSSNRHERTGR